MPLICHVISQEHMTKGWSNIVESPLWQVTGLPSLVTMGIVVEEV